MTRAQTGIRRTSAPRRSSTYASRSPARAPRGTVTTTCSWPGTTTVAGAVKRIPAGVPRTIRATPQVPAPPPASAEEDGARPGLPACEQAERERCGLHEDERPIRACERDDAAALEARAGDARPALGRVGSGLDERRLELIDRPDGVPLPQQRSCARDVRRGHARTRELRPATSGDRREDVDSGCGDIGLQAVRDRRRSDGGELGVRPSRRAAADRDGTDRDRPCRVGGRGHGPGAEIVVVVPGRDDRYDAGGCRRVERDRDDVAARLDLRLATGEVDHVHAVGHRRLDRGDDRG